jgi:hypothetical protein
MGATYITVVPCASATDIVDSVNISRRYPVLSDAEMSCSNGDRSAMTARCMPDVLCAWR